MSRSTLRRPPDIGTLERGQTYDPSPAHIAELVCATPKGSVGRPISGLHLTQAQAGRPIFELRHFDKTSVLEAGVHAKIPALTSENTI